MLLTGTEIWNHQPGAIPGHVRVVPFHPAQAAIVRAPPWGQNEVRAADKHLRLGGFVRSDSHDLVANVDGPTTLRRVMLADTRGPASTRTDIPGGIPGPARDAGLRGQRFTCA